jgi:hypothetical protein
MSVSAFWQTIGASEEKRSNEALTFYQIAARNSASKFKFYEFRLNTPV